MTSRNTASAATFHPTRRTALKQCAAGLLAAGTLTADALAPALAEPVSEAKLEPREWVTIRGIYGGYPEAIFEHGKTPQDLGINAIWVGSGGLNAEAIDKYHKLGLKVFAEFNSMHENEYLKEHPEAAPIGANGKPSPPPDDWQGVSPFHAGYRQYRMDEFRQTLEKFEIDGIWLDYHHAHASWEQGQPNMPDTDFCPAALAQFTEKTGVKLPTEVPAAAKILLGPQREAWTQFRCDVFTDWVREYREIINAVRPKALLGTFHCPWSPTDFDDAIRHKLAIDLPAQAKYIDVFSIMPYHARFGHAKDPAWVSRQTASLGKQLKLQGTADEKQKIWPIVQLAEWGEKVPVEQIPEVLDHGSRVPATGVMIFHWGGVSREWNKAEAMGKVYRAITPAS